MVDIDEMISHPPTDDPSPDEALERSEYKDILEDAIRSLPEKQRVVFQMRYFEEMPYEEMAKVLHKSVGGLKANYFHAVRKVAAYVRSVHGDRSGDPSTDITEEKE